MAKEVANVERKTVKPHKFALEREQVLVECDDGSEYVFERAADSPSTKYKLARRVYADGDLSTSKAILPSSVKNSMDKFTKKLTDAGIERGWTK